MNRFDQQTALELWGLYMRAVDARAMTFAKIYLDRFDALCEDLLRRTENLRIG